MDTVKSDGSTASYYELPEGATELQDLISYRDMNAQIGEIFRACYRYGQASHSDRLRDANKMKFYAEAEIARIKNLHNTVPMGKPVVPPPYTIKPNGWVEIHDPMRNVHDKDSSASPLPRRTMSFESPLEEFVAFIKGDN